MSEPGSRSGNGEPGIGAVAGVDPGSVPVHPEPVAGEPAALRWRVPAGLVPPGVVVRAPGELGELLGRSVVQAWVTDGSVFMWLAAGLSWRDVGGVVRAALQSALTAPGQWVVAPVTPGLVRLAAETVLAGSVGAYAASHGGEITVSAVTAGSVEFELDGACAHCPAQGVTLDQRLERGVHELLPFVEVTAKSGTKPRPFLFLPWLGKGSTQPE